MTTNEATTEGAALQDTVRRLTRYWADEGCLLLPSCDFEVPAGILHPDAFFHLLGAAPWRAAYMQPVRRPLDGRRGEHPYRLGLHLQLQVVLKPPPEDLRGLYLRSLEALGLVLADHDVRFADWRWESKTLAASGSGWRVVIDGLGVTRLTFLERAAGREMAPQAVELCYGVERLSMLLAGVSEAFALRWSAGGPLYGDLRRRGEEELARYVFEVADTDALRHRLAGLAAESRRCLEAGLARPAYELAVQGLQALDVLEARGELDPGRRERWLGRLGRRVVAAAELHLGEPLTDPPPAAAPDGGDGSEEAADGA